MALFRVSVIAFPELPCALVYIYSEVYHPNLQSSFLTLTICSSKISIIYEFIY